MQALTSSFPSSSGVRNNVQLDDMIFYSGPEPTKPCKATASDASESSGFETMFTDTLCLEWPAAIEHVEVDGALDAMIEDTYNAVDTSWSAPTTTLAPEHPQEVSTPLSNQFDILQGGTADEDWSLELQEPLGSWSTRIESLPIGINYTIQPDEQDEGTTVDILGRGRLPEDAADPALCVAFRGANSTPTTAADASSELSQNSQAHAPDAPLYATEFPPSQTKSDVACSDTPPSEEDACVQAPQLDDEGQESTELAEVERALVAQDPISEVVCDVPGSNGFSDESNHDRIHLSRGVVTWDAASTEGSDSDGPPLASHRRHKLPRTRNPSRSPTPPLTSRSSANSTDVELTTALRRRKRLRRRNAVRRDSPVPETNNASEASTMAWPNTDGEWRPVQCFIQRRTNGSREVITIQLPAFDSSATLGRASTSSLSGGTCLSTPVSSASCKSRRRARFSRAEEDLLIKLKEQMAPKLSWREMQKHFPDRTIGSLQVHYCTHLKGRGLSKRQAWGRT